MNCTDVTQEIPNYCYGEISSEAEEAVESHLAGCSDCSTELTRHRKFMELLDEREEMPEAGLLVQCRSELSRTIRQQATVKVSRWDSAMEYLRTLAHVQIPFRIPVGAMALIALGFFGARYTPEKFGGVSAALAAPTFSNVRSVESAASGQVQIAVDEVRRHVVSGNVQDRQIQDLLLSGVTDGSNAGVRLQSIQVLGGSADSDQLRQTLLRALQHDPSASVRLKALEGLKQFAGDTTVRSTLADVLQKDDDANVRVQAIDLLTAHHDDSIVGALQNAVQKEDNSYVREQCRRLLAKLNASVGTY